ncbi:hypothetical protein AVEN_100473-1, partial [Araneus ventricosus]
MDGSPWHLTRPSLLTRKPLDESVSAVYGWMALVSHPSILVDSKAFGRVGQRGLWMDRLGISPVHPC